ncbi:transglutaminase family protein, partial [Planctomycetota bacterium]
MHKRLSGVLILLAIGAAMDGGCGAAEISTAPPRKPWTALFDRALTMTAEDRRGVDREAAHARVAEIARAIRRRLARRRQRDMFSGQPNPQATADSLAAALFGEQGLRGDPRDPGGSSRDLFDVDRVLTTRQGTCLAVVVIGLAAAERAGLDVAPILRPGHAAIFLLPGFAVDP